MKALSYIFIFYIGFYFYRLAENHKRNKWLFGFVGIVTYLIGLVSYPLFIRILYLEENHNFDLAAISLKSFLIGVLSVFFLFQLLSFIWSRKKVSKKEDIDKIGNTKV
ncbi:hypothetical protein [uncultured Polaribacter sp.]|uniref:hypothetical protein n=1 Tax=uncultured Polaribacter sp. TaxID=174711 RepID=UPI0030DB3050